MVLRAALLWALALPALAAVTLTPAERGAALRLGAATPRSELAGLIAG